MSKRQSKVSAPALQDARTFLQIIAGEPDPVMDFRVVPEAPGCKEYPRNYRGRASQILPLLAKKNDAGCGIFYVANRTDGEGRKKANMVAARVVPLDLDGAALPESFEREPDAIVETSPGKYHVLWTIAETDDFAAHKDIVRRTAAAYGGDKSVSDVTRILRMPGFNHMKTGKPFRSRLVRHVDPASIAFDRPELSDFDYLPPLPERATDDGEDSAPSEGELTPELAAEILEQLDPDAFAVSGDGGDLDWRNLAMALNDGSNGDSDVLEVFKEWCARDPEYATDGQQEEIESRWNSFSSKREGKRITLGSLIRLCEQHGVDSKLIDRLKFGKNTAAEDFADDIPFADDIEDDADEAPEPTGKRLGLYDGLDFEGFPQPISPDDLLEGEIIEPTYIVPDLVLDNDATAYYANGGLGKTTKAEMLGAAIAAGLKTWLGEPVTVGPAPVMVMSGESDKDEVIHRIRRIVEGTPKLRALDRESLLRKNLFTYPLFEDSPCLIVVDGKRVKPSPAFHWLEAQMKCRKPRFLILDSLYNFYSEDESDKPLVHQFVMMVRRLAKKHRCAIMLIGHPSLTGIETGRGTSGATTWYNAFRGWIFETADDPKPGKRRTHKLEGKKAQYGAPGKVVECYWHNGCYKAVTEDEREDRAEACKTKFVEMLAKSVKEGDSLNATTGTGKSAYIVFGKDTDNNDGYSKADFLKAMKDLLAEGRIGMRPYMRSNRTSGDRLEPINADATEFG